METGQEHGDNGQQGFPLRLPEHGGLLKTIGKIAK
jgi:hypothetical protein